MRRLKNETSMHLKSILTDEYAYLQKHYPKAAEKRFKAYEAAMLSTDSSVRMITDTIADIHDDITARLLAEQ